MQFDKNSNNLPCRSELPNIPGAPKGAAWFWGRDDELGRLNLLTSTRVADAVKLISKGEVVNLNWEAHLPDPPAFGRESFKHTIKSLGPAGNDDIYTCNTQSGSQWDGFRHASARVGDKYLFYNGVTQHEIETTSRIGIQAWANHGIAGRGVLIDYWSFAQKSYDPNTTHKIALSEILACAKAQNVEFKYGDILMIRTGWIDAYHRMDDVSRKKVGEVKNYAHNFVGVDQSEDVVDFLHDQYFSVVAGDNPAFEAWPTGPSPLHTFLLPLWGVPIGEMWDLERLSEQCKKYNKYEFFFTSVPTNVAGGVGSYSNAIAIF